MQGSFSVRITFHNGHRPSVAKLNVATKAEAEWLQRNLRGVDEGDMVVAVEPCFTLRTRYGRLTCELQETKYLLDDLRQAALELER